MSNDQRALEEICAILNGLDEDSPVKVAFEAVLGYAERNIENGGRNSLYKEYKALCKLYDETADAL